VQKALDFINGFFCFFQSRLSLLLVVKARKPFDCQKAMGNSINQRDSLKKEIKACNAKESEISVQIIQTYSMSERLFE